MNRKKLTSFAELFEIDDVTTFFYCRNVLRSRKDERSSEFFRVYLRRKEGNVHEEAEETRMCASAKRHWRLLAGWNFRLLRLKGVWGREREMINKVNFLSFLSLFLFSVAKIRKAVDDDVCLCKFLSGRTILLSFAFFHLSFFHLSPPFFRPTLRTGH